MHACVQIGDCPGVNSPAALQRCKMDVSSLDAGVLTFENVDRKVIKKTRDTEGRIGYERK